MCVRKREREKKRERERVKERESVCRETDCVQGRPREGVKGAWTSLIVSDFTIRGKFL